MTILPMNRRLMLAGSLARVVKACLLATRKKQSYSPPFWRATRFSTLPTRWPRWSWPVGVSPVSSRGRSGMAAG